MGFNFANHYENNLCIQYCREFEVLYRSKYFAPSGPGARTLVSSCLTSVGAWYFRNFEQTSEARASFTGLQGPSSLAHHGRCVILENLCVWLEDMLCRVFLGMVEMRELSKSCARHVFCFCSLHTGHLACFGQESVASSSKKAPGSVH